MFFQKDCLYEADWGLGTESFWQVKYACVPQRKQGGTPAEWMLLSVDGFGFALPDDMPVWHFRFPSAQLFAVHDALQKAYALHLERWQVAPKEFPEGYSYLRTLRHGQIALRAIDECLNEVLPDGWRNWNEEWKQAPATESEYLEAVPLAFQLHYPDTAIEQEPGEKTVHFWDEKYRDVTIHGGYKVTYRGQDYHSLEFPVRGKWAISEIATQQNLIISGLEQVLVHIQERQ